MTTIKQLEEEVEVIDNRKRVFGYDITMVDNVKDISFNLKQFYQKAYKAYRKGYRFFIYKGGRFQVPMVPIDEKESFMKNHIEEIKNRMKEVEVENQPEEVKEFSNLESINQW